MHEKSQAVLWFRSIYRAIVLVFILTLLVTFPAFVFSQNIASQVTDNSQSSYLMNTHILT